MGRELQKKKRRSGRQPIRQSNRTKKTLNPRGNDIIAKNWDKKETLAQNYKRLGLAARLRAPTGGVEKAVHKSASYTTAGGGGTTSSLGAGDTFAIKPIEQAIVSEARVERDANGKIIRVYHSSRPSNPLNEPLAALDSGSEEDDDAASDEAQRRRTIMMAAVDGAAMANDQHGKEEEWAGIESENDTEVVRSLVRDSRNPAEKRKRHVSRREREWLERLVEKHGEDYQAMGRDARLNPMQQTAADIKRRIQKLAVA